jgi:hypothetical protein
MLVNYEKAVETSNNFLGELMRFLHIETDGATVLRALKMIDPKTGYRRISREDWKYRIYRPNGSAFEPVSGIERRLINVTENDGELIPKKGGLPIIAFLRVKKKRVRLRLDRVGEQDTMRVVTNVGDGFFGTMAEEIRLLPGPNIVELTAPHIQGVRIFPNCSDGKSNIRDLQLCL